MNDLASCLNITNGALTSHIKKLEDCGLITIASESAGHGNQKICSVHLDKILIDIDSPEALEMYRKIDGRLPILMHMGDRKLTYSKPERLARVLEMFPKQVFIAAHLGGYSAWEESKQCLIGKNIFIDNCSALPFLSAQEAAEIIRAHGTKRVFFGTDYPMWQHEEELERFLALPLTEQEREDILFNNAAALLGVE